MDMQLLPYFSYYSMSWCNSLHHIMLMLPCAIVPAPLLTRYPQFPQGYPQDDAICCTSIMQKIWNVAIFSITNGNKKWKYFPTTPKSSFLKNFSTRLHNRLVKFTSITQACVCGVLSSPPRGTLCVLLGGHHVRWTHTNT